MTRQQMHHYMQLQREAIRREYERVRSLCITAGQPIPGFDEFALLWIQQRAENFRQWYQITHGSVEVEQFPCQPVLFFHHFNRSL